MSKVNAELVATPESASEGAVEYTIMEPNGAPSRARRLAVNPRSLRIESSFGRPPTGSTDLGPLGAHPCGSLTAAFQPSVGSVYPDGGAGGVRKSLLISCNSVISKFNGF
jgi:hypothetical protein